MKKVLAIALVAAFLMAGCSTPQNEVVEVVVPENEATPTPEATATATPEPAAATYVYPQADKLAEAVASNGDTVGWITIPGTNIDYPIMFGEDWYYSNHNSKKEKAESGSVYSHMNLLSYEHYKTDQNLVVTAHNSRSSKTMFHELHHVQEVNLGKANCAYEKCAAALNSATLPDFSTTDGRTWDISVCGISAKWEVWAMYEVAKDEDEDTLYYNTWFPSGDEKKFVPKSGTDVQKWIDYQTGRSQYDFKALGVTPTTNDQFLTLYTCGDNHDSSTAQSRLYFFLRQVEPASAKFKDGVRVAVASGTTAGVASANSTPVPEA